MSTSIDKRIEKTVAFLSGIQHPQKGGKPYSSYDWYPKAVDFAIEVCANLPSIKNTKAAKSLVLDLGVHVDFQIGNKPYSPAQYNSNREVRQSVIGVYDVPESEILPMLYRESFGNGEKTNRQLYGQWAQKLLDAGVTTVDTTLMKIGVLCKEKWGSYPKVSWAQKVENIMKNNNCDYEAAEKLAIKPRGKAGVRPNWG